MLYQCISVRLQYSCSTFLGLDTSVGQVGLGSREAGCHLLNEASYICHLISSRLPTSCGSMGVCRLRARVGVRNRDLRVLQWRRRGEASHVQDLLLVKGLPLQQGLGQRVELPTVLREETESLFVALIHDAEYLLVYAAGGLLAEGLLARKAPSSEVRVLSRGELNRTQLIAHPPAGYHPPRQVGGLLDVVLGPCCLGAVDDLLRAAPSKRAYDPRPQVPFRVVVAVVFGTLVGDAQGLTARDD